MALSGYSSADYFSGPHMHLWLLELQEVFATVFSGQPAA